MADAPEMVVVDPDEPTDLSVKQTIMSIPTWEEWLTSHGFKPFRDPEQGRFRRSWPNQGRGWELAIYPATDTIHVVIRNNPFRHHRQFGVINASEKSLPKVVQKLIDEIERGVSDASKKRRIKAYAKTRGYEDRNAIPEALGPRNPIPEDPGDADLSRMLDRIVAHCYQKGQRVKVKSPAPGRLGGLTGTVVDAGQNSCYVALDDYVNAGDDDPFRFSVDELETLHEGVEDDAADAPEPYIAALDYIIPLKHAGYKPTADRRGYYKYVHGNTGVLDIKVRIPPEDQTKAAVFVEYRQHGESDHVLHGVVDALDAPERVRELEALYLQSTGALDYVNKLRAKNYPHTVIPSRDEHLIYLFGESLVPDDADEPQVYLDTLYKHADVINAFRAHAVKMGRRMSADRPYYRLFYIPNVEVSYDIYLTPQADGSWAVTADGLKEFQDARGNDFQQEFDIDSNWTIAAGAAGDELASDIDDILHELRLNKGPAEPTIEGPDVDAIDENIDDPPEDVSSLHQQREDIYKQEGFEFKPDYRGHPRWQKLWPLPTPITTGKTTLTHVRLLPTHGKLEYALVDASGRPKGGFYIEALPYRDVAGMRKVLLKSRRVLEQLPADVDFNNMLTYLRTAFDSVEGEAADEALGVVRESVDDPDAGVDPAQYADATLNVPKILEEFGYRFDGLAHFPHWTKHISPEMMFVVFDDGIKWKFQVYTPAGHGRWRIKGTSEGREVSTMRDDLKYWEDLVKAGTFPLGESEEEDVDAGEFTRSTYDPEQFLKAQGWVPIANGEHQYFVKTFATPMEYHMGNMVFTGIQVRIAMEPSMFKSVQASALFVGRDDTGFYITHRELQPQLIFAGKYPPDSHKDINMPIRRFATEIGDVLQNVAWPEARHAAPIANSKVKQAFDALVTKLNGMADQPLHPALEEDIDDPDEPSAMLNSLPPQTYVLFVRHHDEDDEMAQEGFPGLPLEQALPKQLLRELAESKLFDMNRVKVASYAQPDNPNIYHVRLLFVGQDSDVNLRDNLYAAIREVGVAGEFVIEQFRPEPEMKAPKQSRCRHCDRAIRQEDGVWVDPEATGDDNVWRETCDTNETFAANHEPMDYSGPYSEALDPDDPEGVLQSHPGFSYRHTTFMGYQVFELEPGAADLENQEWPQEIGNVLQGPNDRWYVVNIRGVPQERLGEFKLGVRDDPRTFDEQDQAAMAIWLVRQEMPEREDRLGKKRYLPRKPLPETMAKAKPNVAAMMGKAQVRANRLKSKGWTAVDFVKALTGDDEKAVNDEVRKRKEARSP